MIVNFFALFLRYDTLSQIGEKSEVRILIVIMQLNDWNKKDE